MHISMILMSEPCQKALSHKLMSEPPGSSAKILWYVSVPSSPRNHINWSVTLAPCNSQNVLVWGYGQNSHTMPLYPTSLGKILIPCLNTLTPLAGPSLHPMPTILTSLGQIPMPCSVTPTHWVGKIQSLCPNILHSWENTLPMPYNPTPLDNIPIPSLPPSHP